MKIERLRKNHKKEIIIGAVITVCLISTITFVATRAKYRVTQDIKLAKGTVNYKPYDFKIMAMYQQNDSGSYIEIQEMPTSEYIVNEEKSYCTKDNATHVKGKIKTIDGNHVITNLSKGDKCYIWFDKKPATASETILTGITVKDTAPNFSATATTDEGIYKVADDMYGGTSYYWRGAATTNHVIFANKCWRIVRINGDGTIRLIYNGTLNNGTCTGNGSNSASVVATNQAYGPAYDSSEHVGYTYTSGSQRGINTSSNLKAQTDSWYSTNVKGTDAEKVADGKFCNDRNVASGYSWSSQPSSTFYYAAGYRLETHGTPTLNCSDTNDIYALKAGAITMDEVVFAGAVYGQVNTSYYLYNGRNYLTMTPFYFYNISGYRLAYVVFVASNGDCNKIHTGAADRDIRPVINLKADTTFSSGNGTQNNPYVVE